MRLRAAALLLVFAASSCTPPQQTDAVARTEDAVQAEPELNPGPEAPPTKRRARAEPAPEPAAGGYQYIDESGSVRMAASLDEVPERQRSTVTALATAKSRRGRSRTEEAAIGSAQRADVVIYSTPGCGACRMAKAYFDQKGVDYTDKDVSSDAEAYAEYEGIIERPGVPVIVVGEEWMQGWSQAEFNRLLASAH